MKTRSFALLCWLTLAGLSGAEVETWENTEGKTMEAELIRVDDEAVVFKMKSSGKELRYPLAKLSEESRKRVEAFKTWQEFAETAPKGVDPKQTSLDPDYGMAREKPLRIGSKEGAEKAVTAYFDVLVDAHGKKVKYEQQQSLGELDDGHIVYTYLITHTDGTTVFFVDSEHPEIEPSKQLAPLGFWKKPAEK